MPSLHWKAKSNLRTSQAQHKVCIWLVKSNKSRQKLRFSKPHFYLSVSAVCKHVVKLSWKQDYRLLIELCKKGPLGVMSSLLRNWCDVITALVNIKQS